MARYERKFQEICSPSTLKSILKRKKCIEKLVELYQNEEAKEELDANSKDESETAAGITWTNIIHSVHKILLCEVDKAGSAATSALSNIKNDYSRIMIQTITKANSSEVLVSCKDLVQLVIEILSDEKYIGYRETYLAILVSHILPVKQYQAAMSSDHWRELFELSIELYKNARPNAYKSLILEAICGLLEYGCRQSHLALHSKKIFSILVQVFQDAKSERTIFSENVFKTAKIVCEVIGPESRIAVCKFGEEVMQSGIELNSSFAKYDWMLLVVRAHHPGGKREEVDAAYACDWNAWKIILRSIYIMVLNDCKSNIPYSDGFVQLACEVSWQLEGDNTCIDNYFSDGESDHSQRPKRRKTVNGIEGLIDDLTTIPLKEREHSIQILIALVTKYPESINERNLNTLMQFLSEYLTSCSDVDALKQLWELGRVTFELNFKLLSTSADNLNNMWEKIWNIALSSDSIKNNDEQVHKFLQSFIKYKKVIDSDGILNLYLKDTIAWSKPSIQTLLVYCQHNVIRDSVGTFTNENQWQNSNCLQPVKFRLLQWVLAIPSDEWNAQFPIEDTCELLLGLTLKSWHNINQITVPDVSQKLKTEKRPYIEWDVNKSSESKRLRRDFTNMECIHLITTFEDDLYDETVVETIPYSEDIRMDNVLYVKENRDLLINSLFGQKGIISELELPINKVIVQIAVVARIVSNLEQSNMSREYVKEKLSTVIKKCSGDISEYIKKIVNSKKFRSIILINSLEALYLLYKTRYQSDVASVIQSSTEPVMLEDILRFTNVESLNEITDKSETDGGNTSVARPKDSRRYRNRRRFSKENDEDQKVNSLSKKSEIRIKACTVLLTFLGMTNGDDNIPTVQELKKSLLNPERYDPKRICDLKMATTVLNLLLDCELASFPDDIVDSLLKLLEKLYHIWHNDGEAARDILNISSKLFVRTVFAGLCDDKVKRRISISILSSFHQLFKEHETGPMVYITFIECLETIARIDPTWIRQNWNDGNESKPPAIEYLLTYIESPFHVVRLRAINCLQTIFASKHVDLEWSRKVFSHLGGIVYVILGKLDGTEAEEDERKNRIASALHMMAVVIYSSAIFRSEALLLMFSISVDKNIGFDVVKKVLERISASLKIKAATSLAENYLNYLLTNWLERNDSLDKFPISLIGCMSEQDFYQQYISVIMPIIVQKKSLKDAKVLCKKYGIPFKDAIEHCFPRLVSWLLPHVSVNSVEPPLGITSGDIERGIDILLELNRTENELQGLKELPVLVQNNLESIIFTMIKRLHDEEYSRKLLNIPINYPSSDPPHFKCQDIKRSFKYLENNVIKTDQSLLHLLATEKQDIMQKVLLNLKCDIHTVNSDEYKLKALHHYAYFSAMIMEEIQHDYFDEMAAFVIRDICHTLVHFAKQNSDSISQAAYGYLYHLLKKMLPKRHEEIQQNLRSIVNSITTIVKLRETSHAYNVLKFLVVEEKDVFENTIKKLDLFPVDDIFEEMRGVHSNLQDMERRQSLKNEIQHFLNTRVENTMICSVTELEYLLEKLSKKKEELKEMYQELESVQEFSEDCDLLHRLICALVKLTASSDLDISLMAAKCLGELGPADLSTMILRAEKGRTKQLSDPILVFTYRVLILLSNFLIHSDVQLVTASSEALYIIMSSFWGQAMSVEGQLEKLKCETSPEFLQIEYIRPFVTKSSQTSNTLSIDETKLDDCTNENTEIWTSELNNSYRGWIINITCRILDCFSDSYLNHLVPVCRANESFCEKILPWIIHLVIIHTKGGFESRIYENVNRFFRHYFEDNNNGRPEKKSPAEINKHKRRCFKLKSVRCMLNVVDFVRSQTPLRCQFEFNYLDIAKAAKYCSAYFTSVLYAELWCENMLRDWLRTEGLTPIDYICEKEPENGKVLQEILKEACIKIGDPDAIYGCGTLYFQNPSAKLEHYAQIDRWDKVLLTHDIELSLGNKTATKGLLDALQHSGLEYLLKACASKINKEEQDIDMNHQYECAWRLSDWNMPLSQLPIIPEQDSCVRFQDPVTNDYSLFRYQILKSFHEDDTVGFETALKNARMNAIQTLRNISLESCKTIYPVLSQLQMLREVEEIYFASSDEYNSIIEKWKRQDSIRVNDFQYIEPILLQRTIFLLNHKTIDSNIMQNSLVDMFLQLAESSQDHGYFRIAARALGSLLKQERLPPETSDILQYREAVLTSTDGNHDLGRRLFRNLIVKKSLKPDIRAQVLTTYGNWMAETKSENPEIIKEKYYEASLECSREIENPTQRNKKNMLDTQAALAQFADVQYHRLITYMKSQHFKSLKECSADTKEVIEQLSAKPNANEKQINKLKEQTSIDEEKEKNIKSEKDIYLLLAVKNYIDILQQGDDHDLLVFKLVSLWLDNARLKDLSDLLGARLESVPSCKFIVSVPQLAPHMNVSGDAFSEQIYHLLKRCAVDHPHHTLPVLLLLMNSHTDDEFDKSKIAPPSIPEPRVLAATKLIEELETTAIGSIIEGMKELAYSLIMLANLKTPAGESEQFLIPEDQSILRSKNLEHILVPTLSIDVNPNGMYDQIIGVYKFDEVYDLVGGMNVPKKITCVGTDGKNRYQLVKGDDDLRQDAVMQQVFTVMNVLLRTSKEAVKRKLRVRTYKVVPLSKRSGILEWCDNTTPIGKVLQGPQGLHEKYYPDDYTTKQCKDALEQVRKSSVKTRFDVFMHCCKNLHPAFHYFFLESYPSPEIWFERRLSYMHSIATTSIIGYILGLGDRHLFNMLIEKSTAEVIHIDFGIAFDQGKTLPFPETVPFRLSRDIEAAMGASGIEGVFRRSCEETLTVLRHQGGVIITLLQVLLYDPLSSWEITPDKVMNLQKYEVKHSIEGRKVPGETNKLAERALLQLEQKLRGIEEGSPYSVAGQVEKLIQEARDPRKLSLAYWEFQPCL